METLQAQLDEVNAQIAEEQAKGPQKDADVLAGLEQKQAVILMNMDEAKTQEEQENAKQVRIQAQEEKVDSIVLPYDFNDLFSDDDYKNEQGQPHKVSKANSMIIELVKEFQRKAYEDHNEEMRARDERELQLKRQNESLQERLSQENAQAIKDAEELTRLEAQIAQLQLDKQDSDSKRDAAVKQLEESQAEIAQLKSWNDDLRAQAAQGVRKAIDVVDISPTDKLAQMVKETNEQKANRALSRWSEIMPEVVAPPVVSAGEAVFQPEHSQADIPAHPVDEAGTSPIPADHTEVAAPVTFPVSSGDTMARGASTTDGQGAVTRAEFEALKAIVMECAHVCDVDIAEVA